MYSKGDVIEWNGDMYEVLSDHGDGFGDVKNITPDPDTGIVSCEIITDFVFNMFGYKSTLISSAKDSKELDELEYLRLFYEECSFGPAHEDVIDCINDIIEKVSGLKVPEKYK